MSKKIGVFVGSLREKSFTRSIAEAMLPLFPEGYQAELVEIGHLPHFNQDYDEGGQLPESYPAFRKQVEAFDGFLFATPEYNRSVPAVLKNALDVASRPYGQSKWANKPAAVVSVSPGRIGGFGANHHLRQVLSFLNVMPVQQPEAYVGEVIGLLDGEGNLINEETRALLKSVVDRLVELLK